MRIDRRLLGWGLFLLVLGAVPLLVQAGSLPSDVAGRWWTLWPLLLIAAGIGAILGRTRFAIVGTLVTSLTFGFLLGSILAGGLTFTGGCDPNRGEAFAPLDGSFGQVANADLSIDGGGMTIDTADGTGWRVDGSTHDAVQPRVDAAATELRVRGPGGTWTFGEGPCIDVHLPTATTLSLDLGVNAGSIEADLEGAQLDDVRVGVNAGSIQADLGAATAMRTLSIGVNAGSAQVRLPDAAITGSVEVNAGSAQVCPPDGAAVRLDISSVTLGSIDAPGLEEVPGGRQTPGYDSAETRIRLRVQTNLGSIAVRIGGSCGG